MLDGETELDIGQGKNRMIREIDHLGRVNLSRKALFGEEEPPPQRPQRSSFGDRGRPRNGGGRGGFGGRDNRSGGNRSGLIVDSKAGFSRQLKTFKELYKKRDKIPLFI
ncbi:MAG: hypothetical protein CM1200mP15_08930 [Dehalococcoidia bacterium]|nr:MAG: hypothetical protein CM1200mP15_08930 [Dehalococcoidia bacterium]